jgi:DNA replication initiation complex subunit (GINS family)
MSAATQPVSVADLDDVVYRAIDHYRAHLQEQSDEIGRSLTGRDDPRFRSMRMRMELVDRVFNDLFRMPERMPE